MATREEIQQDAESALRDVQRLRNELLEFSELQEITSSLSHQDTTVSADLQEFRTRVAQLLDRLQRRLRQLRESSDVLSGEPVDILEISTLAQEIQAEVEWLEGVLLQLEEMIRGPFSLSPGRLILSMQVPVRSAIAKIRSYLIPLIKRFLSKLWTIISGLMTPKEWKLRGKVGTGMLGLADVEVEVTFGR